MAVNIWERVRGSMRRSPRPWLIGTSAVVVVALGAGAFGAGIAVATTKSTAVATVAATHRPQPTKTPVAGKVRTCSVAGQMSDARLANMQVQVRNANTSEVLLDRGGNVASRTASVLKVPTTAAALSLLGPDWTASTRVVKGSEPGSVVIIGGGDVTLSRTPSGTRTVYAGAPHLDDLASQVQAAWNADPAIAGQPITKLIVDTSFFSGDAWESSWNRKEEGDGYQAGNSALMVDGGRDDPNSLVSPRSSDPAGQAASAFADLLGGPSIEYGTAPAGAATLGEVRSAPLSSLIPLILLYSDNVLADSLARHMAVASGSGSDWAAVDGGIKAGLKAYGIDTSPLHFADGSGLSDNNAVTPNYLTQLFQKINAREGNLGMILDNLPISGQKGSLNYSDRFTGDNAIADGAVWAKTGWIDTGYTLSGIIYAQDGTPLTFAIYALGDVTSSAKQAIDTLAAGIFLCGDNLSNN